MTWTRGQHQELKELSDDILVTMYLPNWMHVEQTGVTDTKISARLNPTSPGLTFVACASGEAVARLDAANEPALRKAEAGNRCIILGWAGAAAFLRRGR